MKSFLKTILAEPNSFINAYIDCTKDQFGNIAKILINHDNSDEFSGKEGKDEIMNKLREHAPQLIIIEGYLNEGEPFMHWVNLNRIIADCVDTQILITSTFSDTDFLTIFRIKICYLISLGNFFIGLIGGL